MRIPRRFMGGGCSRRRESLEHESDDGIWELIELSAPKPPPPPPLEEPLPPPPPPPRDSVARFRWKWAITSVLAIARKRKYFAFLGAYLQLNKDSSPQRKRIALEWQRASRRLHELHSTQLFGHLVRRHGRLCYARKPIQNL